MFVEFLKPINDAIWDKQGVILWVLEWMCCLGLPKTNLAPCVSNSIFGSKLFIGHLNLNLIFV